MPWLLAGALLACAGPVSAQPKHPAEERGIKSLESSIETRITFVNRCESVVKIYWIDKEGKRKFHDTLQPDKSIEFRTYVTHPWLVTDAKDNLWGMYLPDPQPRTVELKGAVYSIPAELYEKRTIERFTVLI